MKPYYEHGGITIYHGDCREVLPGLDGVDLVLTDPPYGVNKRERTYHTITGKPEPWDNKVSWWWMSEVAASAPCLAFTPGVSNLVACPATAGELEYKWTLSVHVTNGMTRGAVGFGNWIPCVVYALPAHTVYSQNTDAGRITIGAEPKPAHPCPKPLAAIRWMLRRLHGQTILDPFMGSGTTLRAAKDLGRKAIGIEIEEAYCEIAAKRMGQEVLPFK